MSVFGGPFARTNTRASEPERHIDLADNTRTPNERQISEADLSELLPAVLKRTSSRVNPSNLIQELSNRKYVKYSKQRYSQEAVEDAIAGSSTDISKVAAITGEDLVAGEEEPAPLTKTRTSVDGVLRRGQQKIKQLMSSRRRTRGIQGKDTEIDVLYENQRGAFFFGNPLYSSRSLLNFDSSPWTNSAGEPSSVNITNAQLPDPGWAWVWKAWYVDMSPDVDEQGWQYNLLFRKRSVWHGTHPWFHSFVRRRRWIRQRVRRNIPITAPQAEHSHHQEVANIYKLNADYFSVRAAADDGSLHNFVVETRSSQKASVAGHKHAVHTDQDLENDPYDLPMLLVLLKKSTVDREKINLVLEFMEKGGEDTFYLATEIPNIMSMLIYQHSKRQLLTNMIEFMDSHGLGDIDLANAAGEENSKAADSSQPGIDNTADKDVAYITDEELQRRERKHDRLIKAVEAAQKEIENLEYWSDKRQAEHTAQSLGRSRSDITIMKRHI